MGVDEFTPRQVAPSVGKNSAGLAVSPVPSEDNDSPITSTNGHSPNASTNDNSPATSANQISPTQATHDKSSTRSKGGSLPASPAKNASAPLMLLDPHSPELQETFLGLESGLDLTAGAFNFFVNNLGMQDLTDPRQLASDIPKDPSTASVPMSILGVGSPTTTMSTREFNKYMTKEL